MPDSSMRMPATARSTVPTIEAGPRTWTSSSLSTGSSISNPSGTWPKSTSTGTIRSSMRSIETRTVGGTTSRTSMPSKSGSTWTSRNCGSGARAMSYSERSTVAANAWSLTAVSGSGGVRYCTSTKPRSPLRTIEPSGWFTPSTLTAMLSSSKVPEKTSPVYRTVASRIADSLRCQLRSRMPISASERIGAGPLDCRGHDPCLGIDRLVDLVTVLADLPSAVDRAAHERDGTPWSLRADEAEDPPSQLLLGQVPLDPAADDEADRAGLLADHDDDGIGLLADADGGTVPRPVAL